MPKKPLVPVQPTVQPAADSLATAARPIVAVRMSRDSARALQLLAEGMTVRDERGVPSLDPAKLDRLVKVVVANTDISAATMEEALREAARGWPIDPEGDPRWFGV